ncbi:UDP-glucose/GDP-mannose dehydrogenase family protein [Bacillus sp. CGMCC 1.16541]|uniref:UDP-glucose dehydrogenase family protein n=1 Tax=Bacillus sp. CGMCC 1.16541 TaxID=2185143 RepID=UPI0013A55AE1|nr:UDP-glucose/GDP-mannose dehydrogenase family protein [Bacillus sp. CGMCC 1.16541]
MEISIAGTGYVGLVTGVCLSEVGYHVTCYDIDEEKVQRMRDGVSPIYEPGLEELMKKNIEAGRLHFTSLATEAYKDKDFIFIAVGTPEREDGSANLQYVEAVAKAIATHATKDTIVVTKSTVPVGTNEHVKAILTKENKHDVQFYIASNPEFLREGSAVYDTFNGDRIVIGAENEEVASKVAALYEPFRLPMVKTSIRSAEMIKYAANAFLATKISFINEMANICERVGANIDDVSSGIGMDKRIGKEFLRAGIGYGGSCFPKDTKALLQLASEQDYTSPMLQSVIEVNDKQRVVLYQKAIERLGSLVGKRVAVLGLAFKPNTDDIREGASLLLIDALLKDGAHVSVYDPIAMPHVEKLFGEKLQYAASPVDAITEADVAFIVTEWNDIKSLPLTTYLEKMHTPIILDGRNCYTIEEAKKHPITYVSIGRESIEQSRL